MINYLELSSSANENEKNNVVPGINSSYDMFPVIFLIVFFIIIINIIILIIHYFLKK